MPKKSNKKEEVTSKTFQVTALLIKRAKELIHGAPKLIEANLEDPVEITFEEFKSGKLNVADKELKKIGTGT